MEGAVLRAHLRQATESLHNEMRKLIRDLEKGLSVPENDLEELLTVKKALIAVQSRREAQQYTLLTTRSALQHLAISASGRDEKEVKQVQVVDLVKQLMPGYTSRWGLNKWLILFLTKLLIPL